MLCHKQFFEKLVLARYSNGDSLLYIIVKINFWFSFLKNSTDDLEVRVTILEEDVDDLETDVTDLITDDDLQDERLNTIEEIMNENSNDIDGKCLMTNNIILKCDYDIH